MESDSFIGARHIYWLCNRCSIFDEWVHIRYFSISMSLTISDCYQLGCIHISMALLWLSTSWDVVTDLFLIAFPVLAIFDVELPRSTKVPAILRSNLVGLLIPIAITRAAVTNLTNGVSRIYWLNIFGVVQCGVALLINNSLAIRRDRALSRLSGVRSYTPTLTDPQRHSVHRQSRTSIPQQPVVRPAISIGADTIGSAANPRAGVRQGYAAPNTDLVRRESDIYMPDSGAKSQPQRIKPQQRKKDRPDSGEGVMIYLKPQSRPTSIHGSTSQRSPEIALNGTRLSQHGSLFSLLEQGANQSHRSISLHSLRNSSPTIQPTSRFSWSSDDCRR